MKVGIVGCGLISSFHLPHLLKRKSISSICLCDSDPKRSEKTGRQFGISAIYQDFDIMLQKEKPDCIHILTPPSTHAALALKAMESGCHVLVEKPMALTVEDADRMMECADKNNVKLCVDHNLLYDPQIDKARKLAEEGAIGDLLHAEAFYAFNINRFPSFINTSWILCLPGGPLFDLVPHPLSVLLSLVQEPIKVHAVKKCNGLLPGGHPDELRALIDGEKGTGFLSLSIGSKPDCFYLNIYGTKMTVHVNMSNMTIIKRKNRKVPKALSRILDSFDQALQLLTSTALNTAKVALGKLKSPGDVGPLVHQFYQSIENDLEPPITGRDGKRVVEAIDQIIRQIS